LGEWRLEEIIYIGARRLIDINKKIHFVSSEEYFMNDIPLKAKTIVFGSSPYLFFKKNKNSSIDVNLSDIKRKISMLTYNKIIFLSSASVYGFTENNNMFSEKDKLIGTSPYAKEKITSESLIIEQSKKINAVCIIIRIAGLFQLKTHNNRVDNFLDKIFFAIKNSTEEKLNLYHSGNQIRNFCSIFFLKTVLDKLIRYQNDNVQYNVANTTPMKIIDLIHVLNRYLENPLLVNIQDSEEVHIHNALNCSALLNKYPDLFDLQLNMDKLAKMITDTNNISF
jgi:dTDP-D-glucose 4,6-dehydratase